ncbi:MAG: DUF4097 domain-containing protein [Clostridia bacterium]|nr:DUF4097 domain-containing protein [Clostridia bacterium]
MRKATKIWLVVAASLVVIGLIMFASVMAAYHWDFTKLSTVKYETNTYTASEQFSNILMDTETSNIIFAPSDDDSCRVICYEQKNSAYSVAVQDDSLIIRQNADKKWYEYICISIGTPKITVYLPQSDYSLLVIKGTTGNIEIPNDFGFESIDISISTGDINNSASASGTIKVKTTTGNIEIKNSSAGMIDLSATTGKVTVSNANCKGKMKINVTTGKTELTDVSCNDLISNGTTGTISMKNVIADGKISLERNTGNVIISDSDGADIIIKTTTGDVKGILLTEKVFITETSTGRINVPKTTTGGRCEIRTSTGDIEFEVKP